MSELTVTHKVGYVKILCDSQAAIMALASHEIKSLTVMKTIDELNILANKVHKVRIAWVKAHIGTEGNKEADQQAKEGANNPIPAYNMPPPWGFRKAQIETHFNKKWTDYWDNVIDHKHSKRFIDGPDKNKAKGILRTLPS